MRVHVSVCFLLFGPEMGVAHLIFILLHQKKQCQHANLFLLSDIFSLLISCHGSICSCNNIELEKESIKLLELTLIKKNILNTWQGIFCNLRFQFVCNTLTSREQPSLGLLKRSFIITLILDKNTEGHWASPSSHTVVELSWVFFLRKIIY